MTTINAIEDAGRADQAARMMDRLQRLVAKRGHSGIIDALAAENGGVLGLSMMDGSWVAKKRAADMAAAAAKQEMDALKRLGLGAAGVVLAAAVAAVAYFNLKPKEEKRWTDRVESPRDQTAAKSPTR